MNGFHGNMTVLSTITVQNNAMKKKIILVISQLFCSYENNY